jgi:ribosomal protein S27AE
MAAVRADNWRVESLTVECLRCGHSRVFTPGPRRHEEAGSCPRCQYVGWAYSSDLSEKTRRLFRELPLERRLRFRAV